jgi:hypothetical protein
MLKFEKRIKFIHFDALWGLGQWLSSRLRHKTHDRLLGVVVIVYQISWIRNVEAELFKYSAM